MKFIKYITLFLSIIIFTGCEDDIFPELEEAPPQIVVDAWINDLPEEQVIRVSTTISYYVAQTTPGVENAVVYIVDDEGLRYDFAGGQDGVYTWNPNPIIPVFGSVGRSYQLFIETPDGETFTAVSAMNRVPEIDSVRFRFETGNTFFPDSYFAEFFATDPLGPGDTYWIRPYKNGQYLNKPSEISLAFDAGFSAGGLVDGLVFIQPIRDSINPFDTDENDEFLSPYAPGDSVFVELLSINRDAHEFLTEVQIQINRPGGFGELFATPISNVPTNIVKTNGNGDITPLGFFNVSAVQTGSAFLNPLNLPTE